MKIISFLSFIFLLFSLVYSEKLQFSENEIKDMFRKKIYSIFGEDTDTKFIEISKEGRLKILNKFVLTHGCISACFDYKVNRFTYFSNGYNANWEDFKIRIINTEEQAFEKANTFLKEIYPELNIEKDYILDFLKKPSEPKGQFYSSTQYEWYFSFIRQYNGYKFKQNDNASIRIGWNGKLISCGYSKDLNIPDNIIKISKNDAETIAIEAIKTIPFSFWAFLESKGISIAIDVEKENSAEFLGIYIASPNNFFKSNYFNIEPILTAELISLKTKYIYEFNVNVILKYDFMKPFFENVKKQINIWIDAETGEVIGGNGPNFNRTKVTLINQ